MARPKKATTEINMQNNYEEMPVGFQDDGGDIISGAPNLSEILGSAPEIKQESTYVKPVSVPTPAPAKKKALYDADTPIPCRSLTAGFLNMFGGKTKNTYQWLDAGMVEYVEYQDLQYALVGRSVHLNEPLIMIEDEELLQQDGWNRLQTIYDNIYSPKDLTEILRLPTSQMSAVIKKLPKGAKNSIGTLAKTMMEDGRLDSISRVKEIDKILGTDLSFYLQS